MRLHASDAKLKQCIRRRERLVPLLFILILAILSPLLFGEIMLASLHKLHLSSSVALTLVIAMFAGGLVNIPVKRIRA